MAQVRMKKRQLPTTIERFLGLNEDTTGETQLELGESPYMRNFRITENLKLKKRDGYKQLFNSIAAKPIQGMWYGKLNGTYHFLFACNGKIYKHDLSSGTNTEIGSLTDNKTFFFYAEDSVYILNGYEYKKWDGTNFTDVEGYRPTVAIGTPPAGGGTIYEQINLLTGKKKQLFSGDGTSKDYQLAETNIESVDWVKVNGVTKTETTDYTFNLTTGKITFSAAPDNAAPDNVEIAWTKTNSDDRNKILKCMYGMFFGGANDTRIHLWGNPDYKNRRFTSGIPIDGSPSPEYFPVNSYANIGSDEYAITDIVKQYDRQIILKEKGAYYSYYELMDGEASFPVYPLNSEIGNQAPGQTRLILNNPYTIYKGVYEWVATSVRDERNATYISKKVQPSLDNVDLTKAITIDYEEKGEYWLCVDNVVWIFNYRNGTWYQFDNVPATCFIVIEKELYFGTNDGRIMKFEDGLRNDNGAQINAVYELSFYNFGEEWLRKYASRLFLSMKPELRAYAEIKYRTDRNSYSEPSIARYNFATFLNADFNHWSFQTNYNPQPFRFKIKAKKFTYLKLIITSNTLEETATILSISISTRFGGEVK